MLSLLTDVHLALGHPDSAYRAAAELSDRAPFGSDAQPGWFRALLARGQLAESTGQPTEALRAYGRLLTLWSAGEADLRLRDAAYRGRQRLVAGDTAHSRAVVPKREDPRFD